jgi:hypothetical protein
VVAGRLRRWLLAALGFVLLLPIAVLALPRYAAVQPREDPYPIEALAQQFDPSLLADGAADRTVVEIDWVAGCKPGPDTLAGLEFVLRKYSPPRRPIDIVSDQEIRRGDWDALSSVPSRIDEIVRRYAGVEGANQPRTAWRYVLFVPEAGRYFGHTFATVMERDGRTTTVLGVLVSHAAHDRYAKLWIDLDRLQRMTLVHEFGHLLGLVGNPRHERRDPAHRHHCTSLTCSMAHPTWRVIARNFAAGLFNRHMTDYCADCQADIRRTQAYWREHPPGGSN